MANLFFNLPATAGNGTGAAVDTSGMGREKTITVQSPFRGTVNIEISEDGGTTWAQIATFTAPDKKVLDFAAQFTRVRRSGVPTINPGLPNIDIGANDNGGLFASLPATVGDGTGASVDTSALGTFNTVTVLGIFNGTVNVQISDDGTSWAQCMTFLNPGVQSKVFSAQFMRVQRTSVPGVAPGTPVVSVGAINDATASSIGTFAPIPFVVYQPGGTGTGPVVFNDWTALLAQIAVIRATDGSTEITLRFDDTFTSPIVIPVGGPYDMTQVTWDAPVDGSFVGATAPVVVSLPEGSTFTSLVSFRGNIRVEGAATATPNDVSLAHGDTISLNYGAVVNTTGTAPVWRTTGLSAGNLVAIVLRDIARLGQSPTTPVIDVTVSGVFLTLNILEAAVIEAGATAGVAGAVLFPNVNASSGQIVLPQPSWAGTTFQLIATFDRYNTDASPVSTTPNSLTAQRLARYNTTAGNIISNLPTAFSVFKGQIIAVKNELGSNNVIVTPSGAETIDGVASTLSVSAGQGVILSSDGVSNWTAIARFNPSNAVGCWDVVGPFTSAGAPHAVSVGQLAMADMTAGAFTFDLPAISAANEGCQITFKKVTGAGAAFTLDPAGADTITGMATQSFAGARISVTIASDGVSNWMVI